MKKILIATSVALMSTSAYAADYIVPQEPVPVVIADTFSWTGGYIGAHGGYGWGKNHDANNDKAPRLKTKGGFGGIQAGYNWQFDNNLVLGAEADISFGSISKSWEDKDYNNAVHSRYYGKDKIGTQGTLRARLGYAADRFMPYVTGGLAIAETKHTLGCSIAINNNSNGCATAEFETSKSKTKVGYAVGAGVEYAVTNNWTVKTEYLYTNLGKAKTTLNDPNYPNAADRKFKMHSNQIRFGVNYKF